MSDVRSLLRSEQASRRITHPHLSYTRSGQLNCTVCNLLIKSASLWEGHLRSPNHRKNAQRVAEGPSLVTQTKKRKNDDGNDESRKRSRGTSEELPTIPKVDDQEAAVYHPQKKVKTVTFAEETSVKPPTPQAEKEAQEISADVEIVPTEIPTTQTTINEDEWAAFEKEVAPLAQDQPADEQYSATIVAAPVSAAEISAQSEADRRPNKDIEAEEEKEDDERRFEEELDVMEEMEGRIRRLKEKREALRRGAGSKLDPSPSESSQAADGATVGEASGSEEDGDDYDDYNDWGFR